MEIALPVTPPSLGASHSHARRRRSRRVHWGRAKPMLTTAKQSVITTRRSAATDRADHRPHYFIASRSLNLARRC